MKELSRRWALRGHHMLINHRHIRETAARGTRHPEDQDDPGLRYPGYLGEDYGSGTGTLVIYGVHREFRSHNLIHDAHGVIDGFLDASRQLQQTIDPSEDDLVDYIQDHRSMYEIGLSGGWKVSSHLVAALPACGVPFDRDGMRRIAYINASCCQFPELQKQAGDNGRKRWLKATCSTEHPAAEAVTLLQPAVVLCASSAAHKTLRQANVGGQLATVFYNQNGGYLHRPIVFPDGQVVPAGASRDYWTTALRSQAIRAGLH